MLKYGKAIRLIVVAATPVLGLAQTTPVKPSPQQRAQAPAAAKAPAPPAASPDSRSFVTNENYYRGGARAQAAASAPGRVGVRDSAVSATPAVNNFGSLNPAQQQRVIAPAAQPVVAAAISSQPVLPQPAATIPASQPAVDRDASAAVDYSSGQLTVVAERASLGHVLKLIAAKTGAVVDVAPDLQQEPVMAKIGPSPVREVLTSLLDSPRIDYIVFGTGEEPGSLQRIVVRRRQSFGNAGMGVMRSAQAQQATDSDQPDSNGQAISRRNIPGQNEMTPGQRMEDWQKTRAQMLEAEIKQQAQDRENDKLQPQEPPAAPETQQDNPPQL
jgi:hypothetical protein